METVRSEIRLAQPMVLAEAVRRPEVMGMSIIQVDPVRLDPHPGAAVVGVGRVMEPVEGVQSAVLAVWHSPVVAMGGPG